MRKKYHCNQRIREVDQKSLIFLVSIVNGSTAGDCKVFYLRLASLLSIKHRLKKSQVTTWMRTKINLALLRSIISCLRGSRRATTRNNDNNIELESTSI